MQHARFHGAIAEHNANARLAQSLQDQIDHNRKEIERLRGEQARIRAELPAITPPNVQTVQGSDGTLRSLATGAPFG